MATVHIHDAQGLRAVGHADFVSVHVRNERRDTVCLFFEDWQSVADAANDLLNAARAHLEPVTCE